MKKYLTALIEREGDGYVSLCPELDIASQGGSIEEAREHLRAAIELFYETASPQEIQARLPDERQPCCDAKTLAGYDNYRSGSKPR